MKKQRKTFRKILSFILSAALTAGAAASAAIATSASGINPAEQRILDELNTSVSLNGKTRTIPYRYIDQARFYFDTVTCISDENADVIIGKIEEAKKYIEDAGVDNFTDLSDEQIDHLIGIANEASASCGLALNFFLDRLANEHHLDVAYENNPDGETERISISSEERAIDKDIQAQIKDTLVIRSFVMQNIPGSPELSDSDGDGIWTGRVVLKEITADMISELTSGGTRTGKYGICLRIASDDGKYSWGDYEAGENRTCGSTTDLCADAKVGDSILLKVRLDTTSVSRYSEKTADELGADAYKVWDTSYSVEKYIPEESIVLDKEELTLETGASEALSAVILPEDATYKNVSWSSSDESIAAVSEDGTVTASAPGKAVITAETENGLSASCTVTVAEPVIEVENITLSNKKITLLKGESITLSAKISPDNADDKTVAWTSSNDSIVTVEDGFVNAIGDGKALITVTASNGKAASCFVTVEDPVIDIENISLDRSSVSLETGETASVSANIFPENATDKTIIWTSSNSKVAAVSEGNISAVSAGKAIITATAANGKAASCFVTVKDPYIPVTEIIADQDSITIETGKTAELTATVYPAEATDKTLEWNSEDTDIATVSEGTVTAVSVGTTTITAASADGASVSFTVTVIPPFIDVTSISLNRSRVSLEAGKSLTLSVTVLPGNATDKTVLWSSSKTSVATVSGGKITARAAGTAVITAKTANGKTARCTVTVTVKPTSITLSKNTLSIYKGNTATLTATVNPSNAADKTVRWSSSDSTVATVADGKIKALKNGSVTITASTVNGKSAKCTVTVKSYITPTGIKLNRNALTLGKGETYNVTATVLPANASNKAVTWSTANSKIATVSNGKITAVNNGVTTITARTSNGKTASCKITVKNAPSKITVTKGILTLGVGESYKLGSMIDSNASCSKRTFRSSNNSIVKMTRTDWQGEFTAMKPGIAYVTVRTYNGKESSCKVTVRSAPTKISLSKGIMYMKVGQKGTLTSFVSEGSGCATRTFRTSNPGVVKMTRTDWQGEFTAVKKGVAYVTVRTYNGKEASCKVFVQ